MSEVDLHPQIEPSCIKPDGSECTPDFVIEEKECKTIIEHKASLSERDQNARSVFEDIYDKYSPLISEASNGQIAALFPKEDQKTVQLVKHFLVEEFALSSFLMEHHSKTLKLDTIKGRYLSKPLGTVMSGQFEYDFTEFATYKLIRMKPPVPFAADIVWNLVLLPLYGETGKFGDEATIDYQRVLEQTKTQVRAYGRESEDSLRGVVNKALKFLNTLGWARYQGPDKPVVMYPKKGKGMGQVRKLFCEKWFQLKTAGKIDEDSEEDDDFEQKSLEDFGH